MGHIDLEKILREMIRRPVWPDEKIQLSFLLYSWKEAVAKTIYFFLTDS